MAVVRGGRSNFDLHAVTGRGDAQRGPGGLAGIIRCVTKQHFAACRQVAQQRQSGCAAVAVTGFVRGRHRVKQKTVCALHPLKLGSADLTKSRMEWTSHAVVSCCRVGRLVGVSLSGVAEWAVRGSDAAGRSGPSAPQCDALQALGRTGCYRPAHCDVLPARVVGLGASIALINSSLLLPGPQSGWQGSPVGGVARRLQRMLQNPIPP